IRKTEQLLVAAVQLMRRGGSAGLEQAKQALLLAAELTPGDARVIDGLGCVAWRQKRYALADDYFYRARALDPSYARAYAHLALAAQERGSIKEAQILLVRSLELSPLDYQTRNNYAALLAQRGTDRELLQQALSELRKAMLSAPGHEPLLRRNLERLENAEGLNASH
ncbi:MAG TPA: hypothetical protein PLP17_03805, partial [Oligoflexia bacterium]|nr:hypothetical protein [Oligoflexia bacterium]